MNGQLAWAQGTGMPMRPAMSVMMTADVPPTDAADAGLDVRLDLPADVAPGRADPVGRHRRRRRAPASPVEDLTRSHEAWMHLIATRDDLGTFAHVHPQPTGRPGQLAVRHHLPDRRAATSSTPSSGGRARWPTCTTGRSSPSPAPPRRPVTLTEGPRSVVVDGVRVAARRRRRGRQPQRPALHVHRRRHRPAGRRPAALPRRRRPHRDHARRRADLRPRARRGRPTPTAARCSPCPAQTFGPELDVHAEFPTAGIYQLWAQFRLADGDVITVPFTVRGPLTHRRIRDRRRPTGRRRQTDPARQAGDRRCSAG